MQWVPHFLAIPSGQLAKAVRCGEIEVGAELPDRQMPIVPAVRKVCACGAVPSDFGSALGFANHCRKCAVNTRFLAARAAAMARIGDGTARAAATKRPPPDEDEEMDDGVEEKDDGVEDPDCAQILEMFRAEQEAEEAQLLESMAGEDDNEEEEGGGDEELEEEEETEEDDSADPDEGGRKRRWRRTTASEMSRQQQRQSQQQRQGHQRQLNRQSQQQRLNRQSQQ